MKRLIASMAALFTALPALAGPELIGKLPMVGGTAVFELYMDRALLPECQKFGSHPSGLVAHLETSKGRMPYGTGCWIAKVDGNIWMAVKSFEDGILRESVVHSSKFKQPNKSAAAKNQAPTPTESETTYSKKNIYKVDLIDTTVTLESEPCLNGGKKASFVHKLYNIGGYGCWIDMGQKIAIQWTRKKTLNGNIEPFDLRSEIDRPVDMPPISLDTAPTGEVKNLIERLDTLAISCSNRSNPERKKVCNAMEPLIDSIIQKGWCWGPESVPGYEKRWIRCR